MSMLTRSVSFLAAALLASAVLGATTPSYTSIEIRAPAGATGGISAVSLNQFGDVVAADTVAGRASGLVYYHRAGTEVPLLGPAAPNWLGAGGINDLGQVVGLFEGPDIGVEAVEWWKNGGVAALPSSSFSIAIALNNKGTVVGNIEGGHVNSIAASWTGAAHTETVLGVLWADPFIPSYASSSANAINAQGHIAGTSDAGQGTTFDDAQPFGQHAFLYRNGKMLDLGALAPNAPDNDSEAYGINNLDEVVGLSSTTIPARNSLNQPCPDCGVASHAFLWRAGKMTDLGNLASIPGWDSKADAIDNMGEIVGWSDSIVNGASTHRAFLYVGGKMLNLQFYVFNRDPNVRLTEAVAINCKGWIAATGFNIKSPDVSRAYLLIPRGKPQPCT
jgi:probable HAF family extracellular repeat protein